MRTALITGVGRAGQLGEALGEAFAAAGWRVALVGRTAAEVEARADALRAAGHDATAHVADLARAEDTDALGAALRRDHDALDALVCAAGGWANTGPLDASDPAAWQAQLAVNLTTAYLATRAALPLLRAGRSAIVYVASGAALPGARTAGMAAYAAAKSAVLSLMRTVAEEEAPNGVRANAVAPTTIDTAQNRAAGMTPADAWATREEVAAAARWLCDPAQRAVTGQVLRLGR